MKHTPGPWHITRNDFCVWITNAGKAQIAKAFRPAGMTPETCDANARLIAAAPDMAAALQAIVAILDGRQPKDPAGALMIAQSALASIS